jgi:fructokinase
VYDVTALGEILIDFTPDGISENGNILFERNPGGAPANLAVAVARLGGTSAFIGKVGDDMFGRFLKETLEREHVNNAGLILTAGSPTTLAFVDLKENGGRDFSFYRNNSADTMLTPRDVRFDQIKNSRFFHLGSLSLTHKSSKKATMAALHAACRAGVNISYDPNLRMPLWKSPAEAKRSILSIMPFASVIKISEEEGAFITGEKDIDKCAGLIINKFKTPVLLITRGSMGAKSYFCGKSLYLPAFTGVKAVDTTGAGDAFLGAFLYAILHEACMDVRHLNDSGMEFCLSFAQAASAVCVSKKGAIPAMPGREEVLSVMEL